MIQHFFLDFAKKNTIKISYASSISQTKIDKEYSDFIKKYLTEYNAIGVRENSSKQLIEDLIKRNVTINCDPTILIEGDSWRKIGETSKIKIKKSYVLLNTF